MNPLGTALADYLGVRRAFGYRLDDVERYLTRFVAHLDAGGVDIVTITAAVGWAGSASSVSTAADRLTAIRGFARYLQAIDPRHEVPPCGLIRVATTRPVPHLYSDTDIATLMAAARTTLPGTWAATMETTIGMLWATGMRVGEVLRLNTDDLDHETGLLTVWLSKFGKSRLVPLSPSTCAALDHYRHQVAATATSNAMFIAANGTRATYRRFNIDFARLLDSTGIITASGTRPRAHDLRHSFAVRTLLGWYRAGVDVQALLPRLSTYLGHVEPASTYWYLSAAPELMGLAAQRLEAVTEARP